MSLALERRADSFECTAKRWEGGRGRGQRKAEKEGGMGQRCSEFKGVCAGAHIRTYS